MSNPRPVDKDFIAAWFRIGCLSFGGPAGQIALMHDTVVAEKKWLEEKTFLTALNFCMLLPGPEAQQLATYIGWKTRGVSGGLIAGALFVVPGAIVILGLSIAYVLLADLSIATGLLVGVKSAVIAIILQALLRLLPKVLDSVLKLTLAIAAFLAISVLSVPFPAVIGAAALIGFMALKEGKQVEIAPASNGNAAKVRAAIVTALLWASLVLGAVAVSGESDAFAEIALFFSTLAIVTFGGAYAVLAYMADQAVNVQDWLTATEMVDALGLAETTPGPLILVTQFVGFLAGYRFSGPLDPMVGGIVAAIITTLVTFLPSFLWIFLGAPHVDRILSMPRLQGALSGVTSAVLGVIASIALWFASQVLFAAQSSVDTIFGDITMPDLASFQIGALGLTALSCLLLFRLNWSVPVIVGALAAVGAGAATLFGL
ncbi:MAG: chromate efflux transporter [Pseudomonadota bacterium]